MGWHTRLGSAVHHTARDFFSNVDLLRKVFEAGLCLEPIAGADGMMLDLE